MMTLLMIVINLANLENSCSPDECAQRFERLFMRSEVIIIAQPISQHSENDLNSTEFFVIATLKGELGGEDQLELPSLLNTDFYEYQPQFFDYFGRDHLSDFLRGDTWGEVWWDRDRENLIGFSFYKDFRYLLFLDGQEILHAELFIHQPSDSLIDAIVCFDLLRERGCYNPN